MKIIKDDIQNIKHDIYMVGILWCNKTQTFTVYTDESSKTFKTKGTKVGQAQDALAKTFVYIADLIGIKLTAEIMVCLADLTAETFFEFDFNLRLLTDDNLHGWY